MPAERIEATPDLLEQLWPEDDEPVAEANPDLSSLDRDRDIPFEKLCPCGGCPGGLYRRRVVGAGPDLGEQHVR